ncbi:OLC1v1005757C1 [Oldenlandia corymbosa var. corymbosa]|uniref:OLC1v1005757C1 n=1 Tax=Oldenlandia corymbosa var. corymbosa TaxID=529605 RepID=A0AAV1DHS9_OLDCO|nr:OLC1v1005757C1 [Oldenlandia corymbosa var. corymbosa]
MFRCQVFKTYSKSSSWWEFCERNDKLLYIQGQVDYFDHVESGSICIEEVEFLIECLRYCGPHKIYFRDLSVKEHYGMRRLVGDEDLVYLIRLLSTDNPVLVLYRIGIHEPDTLPSDKLNPGGENPIAVEDRVEESDGDDSDQENDNLINFAVDSLTASGWSTLLETPYKQISMTESFTSDLLLQEQGNGSHGGENVIPHKPKKGKKPTAQTEESIVKNKRKKPIAQTGGRAEKTKGKKPAAQTKGRAVKTKENNQSAEAILKKLRKPVDSGASGSGQKTKAQPKRRRIGRKIRRNQHFLIDEDLTQMEDVDNVNAKRNNSDGSEIGSNSENEREIQRYLQPNTGVNFWCALCRYGNHTTENCVVLKAEGQMRCYPLEPSGYTDDDDYMYEGCYHCRSNDHMDDNCPILDIQCSYCKKFAHTAVDCPELELDNLAAANKEASSENIIAKRDSLAAEKEQPSSYNILAKEIFWQLSRNNHHRRTFPQRSLSYHHQTQIHKVIQFSKLKRMLTSLPREEVPDL